MRLVMKFGGTSVGTLERIEHAARLVQEKWHEGHEIVVVVSAMAGVTNELVSYVDDISSLYDAREYDAVLASGEQVTAGLMALVLQKMEVPARSWLGWQLPILTDEIHGKARIKSIEGETLCKRFLDNRQVGIVAGFQGIAPDNRIATLGRGGSDTTAVGIAAAIHADRCDIYTDVRGVYTTDPRIVPQARKLDKISHEEMLEMASLGAKVLQTRSVEMAMNHNVCLQVLSAFEDTPGTFVVNEEEIVEKQVVSGIAYSRDEAKITLTNVQDRPGVSAAIFCPLAEQAVNVDMIIQSLSIDGQTTNMTFTVPRLDLERCVTLLRSLKEKIGYEELLFDANIVKISVIGIGMRSHAGVANTMFQTLSQKGINLQVISTSEIKISTLIDEAYTELALRALHTAYGLDETVIVEEVTEKTA